MTVSVYRQDLPLFVIMHGSVFLRVVVAQSHLNQPLLYHCVSCRYLDRLRVIAGNLNLAPPIVAIPWWGRTDGWTGAARDDFSLFLLRTQWAPEWCCGKGSGYCMRPGLGGGNRTGVGNRLLIHGLWPQWNDAAGDRTTTGVNGEVLESLYWPQYCDGGPDHDFSPCCDQQVGGRCSDTDLEMCRLPPLTERPEDAGRLAFNMPDYVNQPPVGSGGFRLGDHEWMKHGSCSALDAQVTSRKQLQFGRGKRLLVIASASSDRLLVITALH
jgi:ribonuclease I